MPTEVDPAAVPSRRRQADRPGRSQARAQESFERRERRRRLVLVVLVVVGLLAGAAYVISAVMGGDDEVATPAVVQTQVTDFPGPAHGDVLVTVVAKDTPADVAASLVEAGVVADADVFEQALAATAGTVQPGTYRLRLEMPSADAAAALLDPANLASLRVTIPAGLTAEQVLGRINEKTTIPLEDLKAAAADPDSFGLPHEAEGHLEGWLFPATYDIPADASATDVLHLMTARTAQELRDQGVAPADWSDTIVLASLVETIPVPEDQRPSVARVLLNRLDKEQPLAVDATVAYGLGSKDPVTAEQTQDPDNPYNTFVRFGLPPTAIASPSASSIAAVVHPAEGDWMFWVTVNPETGETKYAVTYDEYQTFDAELRAWQEANS